MARKNVVIAAGAIADVAVVGGGAAVAATKAWSPNAERDAIITDAAGRLGVKPSELSSALQKALEDRIDAAVSAGLLTKAQGDALKARIESGDVPVPFGGFGPGGFGFHFGSFGFADLDAAASYLGLTEAQLRSDLAGGKTLAQIAKDQGKSVDGLVDALVTAANKKIDAAVAAGRITQSQANQIKADLKPRVADLVRTLAFRSHFGFRGFGFGRHDFGLRSPGFGFHRPSQRAFGFNGPRA